MKNDMGRDAWPDYMKALGVIFIVFGHSYLPVVFLKLFYVPIFWIITGYYFKDKTFKEHIVSRAKRVYYPFVLTNLVYVIVRNINYFFGGTTFYYKRHDLIRIIIRIFLLDVPDKLASPMWFVTALLSAEMLYLLICKIFRKDLYIFGISIGLYIINFKWISIREVYWGGCCIISLMLTIPVFFCIGNFIKKNKILSKFSTTKTYIIICVTTSGLLTFLQKLLYYRADYRVVETNSMIMFLIVPIIGFILLYCIIGVASNITNKLNKFLKFYGYNSLYIMMFHPLGYMIVGLLQVHLFGFKVEDISIWENYIPGCIWNIIGCIMAMTIPVVVIIFIRKSKGMLWKRNLH